jgi:hypothetical protein
MIALKTASPAQRQRSRSAQGIEGIKGQFVLLFLRLSVCFVLSLVFLSGA